MVESEYFVYKNYAGVALALSDEEVPAVMLDRRF